MKKLYELVSELGLENTITLDDIPNIDLYMDQVTQLFENKYNEAKRNEDEKILTKTMINNYAKAKLLFPIKNKKYSKEHLILISLIYQLKGALSISDVKVVLDRLNYKIEHEQLNLSELYVSHLELHDKSIENFKANINVISSDVNQEIDKKEDEDIEYLESLLLISSLINTSNMYRRLAERLVDEMKEEPNKN
ncbi:DUF1836 domain-containing protein [Aquibacillus rhizosphaerae]|uniref:DUF1836 domain-containing protein n=1 Tax=Aquibacillus rhizosphaerae TaxID=3051431 RepID=A0ABT7L558_9BACI|nr:DUF1836 domain-containing protein [Aquibacillus sp. LR5S19]MDL4841004.1 DUF1836 domain-containing protein [Aquibacillus sp. LR5S19]